MSTNDMKGSDRDCLAAKYTDDATLVDSSDYTMHSQTEVNRVYEWCYNNLTLNINKINAH